MLIWARKDETNMELTNGMRKLYGRRSIRGFKPWELSIILRQIQRHFEERKDISILDFGTGKSPFGAYLNHLGYQDVTCLDIKRGWHRKMNEGRYNREYNASVKYVKTDITQDYDGNHDVICSASVLEHIEAKKRIDVMRALVKHLKPGGLFIHVVDYESTKSVVNFKDLINNCSIPISYNPGETPGCKEFAGPPKYTWWIIHLEIRMLTRVAFWNEK